MTDVTVPRVAIELERRIRDLELSYGFTHGFQYKHSWTTSLATDEEFAAYTALRDFQWWMNNPKLR